MERPTSPSITFLSCWFFVSAVYAYGPLPAAAPPMSPILMDTSPWIPMRVPKYYNMPPPQPVYGMSAPAPKPWPYQRPVNPPLAVQTTPPMVPTEPSSVNSWMPIVGEQATEAPVQQEMAVVFELETEKPEISTGWMAGPALPSTGRLPLAPLAFRVPSTARPNTEPATDSLPPSIWSAAEPQDAPQEPPATDSLPPSIWPAAEPQDAPQAPPAPVETAPSQPLGPPGTFLPLSPEAIPLEGPAPLPPQESDSTASWPDTPKDVPGADLIPPLELPTFGQFGVPPAA